MEGVAQKQRTRQMANCARTCSAGAGSRTKIQAQHAKIVPRIMRNLYFQSTHSGVICKLVMEMEPRNETPK